jgi:hypothetical protein
VNRTSFLLLLALVGCAKVVSRIDSEVDAEVHGMSYVPEYNGTGMGVSSKGSLVVTSQHDSEKWIVVVLTQECGMRPIDDRNLFQRVKLGQRFKMLTEIKKYEDGSVACEFKEYKL